MPHDIPTLSIAPLSLREKDCAVLRPMVASIDSELASLLAQKGPEGYALAATKLADTWQHLVGLMSLGTEPELRACPHCKYLIAVKATRCIECWKQSAAQPTVAP